MPYLLYRIKRKHHNKTIKKIAFIFVEMANGQFAFKRMYAALGPNEIGLQLNYQNIQQKVRQNKDADPK